MFMHEYGLLIAVALPASVIFTMQVLLLASGERGTLLWPATGGFPPVLWGGQA